MAVGTYIRRICFLAAIRAAGDPQEEDLEDYGEPKHPVFIYDTTTDEQLKELLDKPYLATGDGAATYGCFR